MRFVLAIVLVAIISVLFVSGGSAVTSPQDPGTIGIYNCTMGVVSTVAQCGDVVNLSCYVELNYGVESIVEVVFTVNGELLEANLTSGNYTAGTWTYPLHIGSAYAGDSPLSFDAATARSSSNKYCTISDAVTTTDECYGTFSSQRAIVNECACNYTQDAGTSQIDNSITYTLIPNEGCSDQSNTTYKDFYDYCDPQWTVQHAACQGTFSNASEPFTGNVIKSYYKANPGCCAATGVAGGAGHIWFNHNTGSDCDAPLDQGNSVTCREDTWLNYQDDIAHSGEEEHIDSFNKDAYIHNGVSYSMSVQPLVFDVTADGNVEMVAFSNTTNDIRVYDAETLAIDEIYTLGNASVSAQPALWGVDDLGGSGVDNETYLVDWYVLSGKTPLLLVPVKNGSVSSIMVFSFSAGNLNLLRKTDFSAGIDLSGVQCYRDSCYFMGTNEVGYKYDPWLGTYTSVNLAEANVGGVWTSITGVRVDTSLIPVLAYNGVSSGYYDRTVAWPQYQDYTGVASYTGVRVVLTDLDLTRVQVYEHAPRSLSVSGSESQTSYVMRGSPLSYGTKLYFTTEETFDKGGNATGLELAIHGMKLEYQGSPELGTRLTSDWSAVWSGTRTSVDEGISNAVMVDGYPGFAISVLTASEQLQGGSTILPPNGPVEAITTTNLTAQPQAVSMKFVDGDAYYWESQSGGISMYRTATNLPVYRKQITHSVTGGGGVTTSYYLGSAQVFPEFDKVYWSESSHTGGYAGYYPRISCADYSDVGAIVDCSGLYLGFKNNDGYGLFGRWGSDILGKLESTHYAFKEYNSSVYNSYGGITASPVWYDSSNDMMLTSNALYGGWTEYIRGDPVAFSASLPAAISYAAFNFQSSAPKYMDGSGFKYKIESFNPFVYKKTVHQCGEGDGDAVDNDFVPLFYNSDRRILGIDYVTNSGESNGVDGPKFKWCDFSDELNPVLIDTGIVTLNGNGNPTITVGGGPGGTDKYQWVVPAINVYEAGNDLQGDAEWEMAVSGYVGSFGTTQRGVYLYKVDNTREAPSSQAASYTEFMSVDDNLNTVQSVTTDFEKKFYVTAADWDGDGSTDMIMDEGAALLSQSSFDGVSLGGPVENGWALPIDLNSDGTLDVVSFGGVILNNYISQPEIVSVDAGPTEVKNLRCTVIPGSSRVNIGFTATVPSPEDVSVGIDPGDGTGMFFPDVSYTGTYDYSYAGSGEFDLEVQVMDVTNVADYDTATCTVVVNVSTTAAATCSLGVDGEFNYVDSIGAHGWDGSSVSPVDGWVSLGGDGASHSLADCRYSTVSVVQKVKPESGDVMQVSGDNGTVFGYSFSADGVVRSNDGTTIGTYSAGTSYTMKILVDRSSGKAKIFMGTTLLYAEDTTFLDMSSVYIAGSGLIDYVRIATSGNLQNTPYVSPTSKMNGDASLLRGCDNVALENEENLVDRRRYTNVLQYCGSVDGGFCDYVELQKIASRYPDCAKETYNYCVYKGFQTNQGLQGNDATFQGGTLCTALMGGSSLWSGIVAPSVGMGWNLLTQNTIVFFIIVVLLILLIPMFKRK